MRHKRIAIHNVLLAMSWLIFLSLGACTGSPDSNASTAYQAMPLNGDPRITFNVSGDMLLIDITSPTGIGSAAIEKTAGQWPVEIVMRLHVTGLENFRFRYADTSIEVSVSSHGDNAVHEVYEQSGTTGAVSAGDPHWIAVTPGQGYFDLQAPAGFLKSGENKFTIEWIDFYR